MSDTRALGARLLAELEAATEAAVAAHDREQARPITAADAPDSAGVFAALARIDYFNKQAAAGANTVAKLTRPAEWPTPTAQDLAAWMLDRKAKRLPLAAAVAEAAWLSPDDAHTDRERWAHRAAERWLRDFHPANAWGIGTLPFAVLFLSELVIAYLAAGRPREVLDKLIGAWPVSPVERPHETRADRRIMPALRVVGPSPERERGLLFGGLVDDRREADLPLFPELEPARLRVPLLEIVERTGLPFRSRGKGAPVESRLVVRGGLLNLRPEDRHLPVVRIAVTVGEMLYALWPPSPGRGRPRDAENWPKLLDALYRARDFHVPDAAGGRWFPMALRRLPANAETQPARDDLVILDLAPVPGAETGASVVLPLLDRMGVKSGPTWFAYLAGRSLVWLPGKTRRPVPGGRGRYGWSGNPSDYPVLMLADLARFAYGAADTRHRTRAETLSPWQSLPDLVLVENQTDERIGIRGWRLLPTEAALAMRKLGRNLGVSGRNLGVSGRNLGVSGRNLGVSGRNLGKSAP